LLRTSDRFVWLRDDCDEVMLARLQQNSQRRHADFARADENDAHAELWRQLVERRRSARRPPSHRLSHQFFAGRDLTATHRRSAAGAEVIKNLAVWQD